MAPAARAEAKVDASTLGALLGLDLGRGEVGKGREGQRQRPKPREPPAQTDEAEAAGSARSAARVAASAAASPRNPFPRTTGTPEWRAFLQFGDRVGWSFENEEAVAAAIPGARGIERVRWRRGLDVTDRLERSNPVIVSDALRDWKAGEKWTFDFFKGLQPQTGEAEGGVEVIANDRAPARSKDFPARPQASHKVSLAEYVDYAESRTMSALREGPAFYLNGWHAFSSFPELARDIAYPEFVQDHTRATLVELNKQITKSSGSEDLKWVEDTNTCLDKVFLSPPGAITRLHYDAHRSHAWLAQVRGRKLFVLFAPSDSENLYPLRGEQTTQSPVEPVSFDAGAYPRARQATPYVAILEEGELVVVPDGWWHYVVSLEPSVTVMRNFYHATTNVRGLLDMFMENYRRTKAAAQARQARPGQ